MFEEYARLLVWLLPIMLLAVIILPQMIRILREYQRGVIFRLGKLLGAKGPGLIFLIPIVDRMVRMDLRVVTIDVARQEVMTRDNVPMTVDAVVYFRVIDPAAAVVRVENYLKATSLISQTTLRSVLGQAELDELLSQRDKINLRLQEIINRQTDPWGIKVTAVEVRDVVLPDSMKRAMAGQAESERERRAKNHKRRRRVSGSAKTRAGGIDDFCATDRPAIALLTDDEGNFE
jgi:regulator of protease activity HflC (stomatin/prohibitin superfamily)